MKRKIDEVLNRSYDNDLFKNYCKTKEYDCSPIIKSTGFTKLQYLLITYPNETTLLKKFIIKKKKILTKKIIKVGQLFILLLVIQKKYDKSILEYLLENNADINAKTKDDSTPLHLAAELSNTDSTFETVKLLLENKANVYIKNGAGWNALKIANLYENISSSPKTIQLLSRYTTKEDIVL